MNPNNPDGRHHSSKTLRGLPVGRLVVDESFVDPAPGECFAAEASDRLLVLRSFGKFWGLAGAVFLVLCDVVSRIVIPGQVLPIGVVTALVDAPAFAVVMIRGRPGHPVGRKPVPADRKDAGRDRAEWLVPQPLGCQRAHIARAPARASQILLLDEPTNHLDIHHQIGILDPILRLSIPTVIALHDMHHALRCDRVMVMQSGRCVAIGAPLDILTPALICQILAVEAELIPRPEGDRPVSAFRRPC